MRKEKDRPSGRNYKAENEQLRQRVEELARQVERLGRKLEEVVSRIDYGYQARSRTLGTVTVQIEPEALASALASALAAALPAAIERYDKLRVNTEAIEASNKDRLFKVPEAAEYLNVTEAKIRRDIFDKKIEVVRLGPGTIRIRKSYL